MYINTLHPSAVFNCMCVFVATAVSRSCHGSLRLPNTIADDSVPPFSFIFPRLVFSEFLPTIPIRTYVAT